MKKFKFLNFSKNKRLGAHNYSKDKIYLVLHGFMSDIEGKKPQTLLNLQKRTSWVFSFEYSGHGKSSGIFTRNISVWTNDTKNDQRLLNKKLYFSWV